MMIAFKQAAIDDCLYGKRRRYRNCKILDGETNLTVDVNSSDHPNCWSLDLSSSSSYRLSHATMYINDDGMPPAVFC